MNKLRVATLVPWFGSNRTLAHQVGIALAGKKHVTIPCCGGLSEVAEIKAKTILCNDLHRHVINVARCAADPRIGPKFYRQCKRLVLHADVLREAQETARQELPGDGPDLRLAVAYFAATWMGMNGLAGRPNELNSGLCLRRDAGGGDPAKRYQSAVHSLVAWRRLFARCTFSTLDMFDVIADAKDKEHCAIYIDPPFPTVGNYVFKFTTEQHKKLARMLRGFEHTRIVCRFYDHPLIRKLYKRKYGWEWKFFEGRKTSNKVGPEILLVRN